MPVVIFVIFTFQCSAEASSVTAEYENGVTDVAFETS